MSKPVRLLDPNECRALRLADLRQLWAKPEVRNDVPVCPIVEIEGDDLSTAPLHLKAEEAGGATHIEDALSSEVVVAEVGARATAQIPAFTHLPDLGQRASVIEPRPAESFHGPRGFVGQCGQESRLPARGAAARSS